MNWLYIWIFYINYIPNSWQMFNPEGSDSLGCKNAGPDRPGENGSQFPSLSILFVMELNLMWMIGLPRD